MSKVFTKTYEGYIHTNGTLQVKRMIPKMGLMIDRSSPFVRQYLGTVAAVDYGDAKKKLEEKQKEL